jgi:hypothetical protein
MKPQLLWLTATSLGLSLAVAGAGAPSPEPDAAGLYEIRIRSGTCGFAGPENVLVRGFLTYFPHISRALSLPQPGARQRRLL